MFYGYSNISVRNLKYTSKSEGLEASSDSFYNDWTDSTSTSWNLIQIHSDPVACRSHNQKTI